MEIGGIDMFENIVNMLNGKNIYLIIDLDVLDVFVFLGIGILEFGGVNYREF